MPFSKLQIEPFQVSFVQTSYTVLESAGSVEVCVNLTQPGVDILDESVSIFVNDFPSSVNFPVVAALACEYIQT